MPREGTLSKFAKRKLREDLDLLDSLVKRRAGFRNEKSAEDAIEEVCALVARAIGPKRFPLVEKLILMADHPSCAFPIIKSLVDLGELQSAMAIIEQWGLFDSRLNEGQPIGLIDGSRAMTEYGFQKHARERHIVGYIPAGFADSSFWILSTLRFLDSLAHQVRGKIQPLVRAPRFERDSTSLAKSIVEFVEDQVKAIVVGLGNVMSTHGEIHPDVFDSLVIAKEANIPVIVLTPTIALSGNCASKLDFIQHIWFEQEEAAALMARCVLLVLPKGGNIIIQTGLPGVYSDPRVNTLRLFFEGRPDFTVVYIQGDWSSVTSKKLISGLFYDDTCIKKEELTTKKTAFLHVNDEEALGTVDFLEDMYLNSSDDREMLGSEKEWPYILGIDGIPPAKYEVATKRLFCTIDVKPESIGSHVANSVIKNAQGESLEPMLTVRPRIFGHCAPTVYRI